MIDHHSALIYTMVLAAAADADMNDAEQERMGEIVRFLPVFRDFDPDKVSETAEACAELLRDEDGLDKAIELIRTHLPVKLRETAYAIACDVVAADGSAAQEDLRLLEMLRDRLEIDRLVAAAIERGTRARSLTA
jgi:tellurite resistance protein